MFGIKKSKILWQLTSLVIRSCFQHTNDFAHFLGGNILICNNKDYGEMALPDFWFDGGQTEKEEYLRSVLLKLACKLKDW